MRSWSWQIVAVPLVSLWFFGTAWAQPGSSKQDRQGPVMVAVTLMPRASAEAPLTVSIALNTHSVGLDDVAFENAVALRSPGGTDAPPTSVQAIGGGHHRQATLTFAPVTGPTVTIVIKNVGGVSERVFVWDLPQAR